MKNLFILMIAGLFVCTNLSAQGGGRGGGGGGGNFGGGPRAGGPGGPTISRDYDKVQILEFPEISGLDVNKKIKLFSILKNSRKNFLMLSDEKQGLEMMNSRTEKKKEIDANLKSISKLDEKINKENLNTDKKIRSLLGEELYNVFSEKRGQIKYADPPILGRRGPGPGRTGINPQPEPPGAH